VVVVVVVVVVEGERGREEMKETRATTETTDSERVSLYSLAVRGALIDYCRIYYQNVHGRMCGRSFIWCCIPHT